MALITDGYRSSIMWGLPSEVFSCVVPSGPTVWVVRLRQLLMPSKVITSTGFVELEGQLVAAICETADGYDLCLEGLGEIEAGRPVSHLPLACCPVAKAGKQGVPVTIAMLLGDELQRLAVRDLHAFALQLLAQELGLFFGVFSTFRFAAHGFVSSCEMNRPHLWPLLRAVPAKTRTADVSNMISARGLASQMPVSPKRSGNRKIIGNRNR